MLQKGLIAAGMDEMEIDGKENKCYDSILLARLVDQ